MNDINLGSFSGGFPYRNIFLTQEDTKEQEIRNKMLLLECFPQMNVFPKYGRVKRPSSESKFLRTALPRWRRTNTLS